MAIKTPDDSGFLVFGVSNAKYLAFDTHDGNALTIVVSFFRRDLQLVSLKD